MKFRHVTVEDAELLLDWHNDPVTRAFSTTQEKTTLQEHTVWLNHAVNLKHFYIAQVNRKDIGVIRATPGKTNEYTLSWTIAPEERGKGYGREMLPQMTNTLPDQALLIAYIMHTNIASIKIAKSTGFKLVESFSGEHLCMFEMLNKKSA